MAMQDRVWVSLHLERHQYFIYLCRLLQVASASTDAIVTASNANWHDVNANWETERNWYLLSRQNLYHNFAIGSSSPHMSQTRLLIFIYRSLCSKFNPGCEIRRNRLWLLLWCLNADIYNRWFWLNQGQVYYLWQEIWGSKLFYSRARSVLVKQFANMYFSPLLNSWKLFKVFRQTT